MNDEEFEHLINCLNVDLKGKVIDFITLDNFMLSRGLFTCYDGSDSEEIKEYKTITYCIDYYEVYVSFDILFIFSMDKFSEMNFNLKVTEISEI